MMDTLINRRITLLDPSSWADQNDREVMEAFALANPGHRIFAYCMAEGNETAHHWQVFADYGRGARINFSRDRLFAALKADPNISHGPVSYVQWKELSAGIVASMRLPYLKRSVFRFEREYRLVAIVDQASDSPTYDVAIPLDCVTSVYVSGEIPDPHFEMLLKLIRTTPGCERLAIRHSGLLRNASWSRSLRRILG